MITWFKELWFLISVLFDKTDGRVVAEVKKMTYFPFEGYKYMAWCGYILTTKEKYLDIDETSLNHETIHLKQAVFHGRYIWYYLSYLWYWMTGGIIIAPVSAAYYTNPYEMEAYAKEHIIGYNPTRFTVSKYLISDRKKTYKEHRNNWKSWVKEYFKDI